MAVAQDGLRVGWYRYPKAPETIRRALVQVGLRGTEAPASRRGVGARDRGMDPRSRQVINTRRRTMFDGNIPVEIERLKKIYWSIDQLSCKLGRLAADARIGGASKGV